jgi:hypothetical protein
MASCVIEVPSSVTVRSVAEFGSRLCSLLEANDEIVLDLAALSDMDLSFVQLVQSARSYGAHEGKAIRLARPADGAVAALLQRAGFLTDPAPADMDFWFDGDLPR